MFLHVLGAAAAAFGAAYLWEKLVKGKPIPPLAARIEVAPGVLAPGAPKVGEDPNRGVTLRVDPTKEPALLQNAGFVAHATTVPAPYDFYAIGTDDDNGLVIAYLDDRRLPPLVSPDGKDVLFTLVGDGIQSRAASPVPGPGQMPRPNDEVIVDAGAIGTAKGTVTDVKRGAQSFFVDAGGNGPSTFAFPSMVIANLGPNRSL